MSLGALEGSWLESLSIENRAVEKVMRNEPQLLPLKLSVILRFIINSYSKQSRTKEIRSMLTRDERGWEMGNGEGRPGQAKAQTSTL